jgi:hypothetical protein
LVRPGCVPAHCAAGSQAGGRDGARWRREAEEFKRKKDCRPSSLSLPLADSPPPPAQVPQKQHTPTTTAPRPLPTPAPKSMMVARRTGLLALLAVALLLAAGATAAEQNEKKHRSPVPPIPAPSPEAYVICADQTYALCASASAFVYQHVSYAKCVIKRGDSISAPPLSYKDDGQIKNICDVNAMGVSNGYMMSTFSLPDEIKKGGTKAIYTCPGGSEGGYAQCDGGTCFKSTPGQTFPGVGELEDDEIICSCPIVAATTANAPFGWQFVGPYPCQKPAFSVCDQAPRNGAMIPVGSPPGAGRVLTQLLYGQQYELNECFP